MSMASWYKKALKISYWGGVFRRLCQGTQPRKHFHHMNCFVIKIKKNSWTFSTSNPIPIISSSRFLGIYLRKLVSSSFMCLSHFFMQTLCSVYSDKHMKLLLINSQKSYRRDTRNRIAGIESSWIPLNFKHKTVHVMSVFTELCPLTKSMWKERK